MTTSQDPTTPDADQSSPPGPVASPASPPPNPHRNRNLLIGIGAVVAVIAAVAVVVVLTMGGSSDDSSTTASTEYQEKVGLVMAPVLAANERLTRSLRALDDENTAATQRLVKDAQDATLTARGGLSTLTVPEGSEQIAVNLRGTLGREEDYLGAVLIALRNPGSGSAQQTQTLQSNLTDALNTISPDGQDWAQSVGGADVLTPWATRTARRLEAEKQAKARAKARKKKREKQDDGSEEPGGGPSVPQGTPCGGGLYAGPNTSCAFAVNVRDAYNSAPGASATVQVYSPVTGDTYTMSCSPAGSGITCSGGNNASVTWSY